MIFLPKTSSLSATQPKLNTLLDTSLQGLWSCSASHHDMPLSPSWNLSPVPPLSLTLHHPWYPTWGRILPLKFAHIVLPRSWTVKIHPNTWCPMRTLLFFAGWYEGERLRDGERGWFPMECAKEITCQATIDKNVERMGRLLGLETNV